MTTLDQEGEICVVLYSASYKRLIPWTGNNFFTINYSSGECSSGCKTAFIIIFYFFGTTVYKLMLSSKKVNELVGEGRPNERTMLEV